MAVVGQTTGGRNVTVDGAPYDNAMVIFNNKNNAVRNITNDLTGSVTAQPTGNSDTSQSDWGNNQHVMRSGSRQGQGSLPVVSGSDVDKLFMQIYNKLHPVNKSGSQGAQIAKAYHDYEFTLYLWRSDEVDNNGNPTKYATCEYCYFTNQPATNMNNGTSNSANTDSWPYSTAELVRHLGAPVNMPGLP